MGYRFLDHLADVAFEAWGHDRSSLFKSAAEATLRTMIEDPGSVKRRQSLTVELEHDDLDLLLFDFLQEMLFLKDSQYLLLRPGKLEVRQTPEKGWRLTALLEGEPLDPSRHPQAIDVKAVTLHQFQVEERQGKWWCHVILDV